MSEFSKESLPNLELKIENMLDKLIETDEELEKKGDYSTSKINEEISNYEDEKYFEKDVLKISIPFSLSMVRPRLLDQFYCLPLL